MNQQDSTPMTGLDQMVSDDQLQILKAIIPYVSPHGQRFLSIYSKVRELHNTMNLMPNQGEEMRIGGSDSASSLQPLDILNEIRPFCSKSAQQNIDQVIQIFAMLQMAELFQDPDHL